MRQFLTLATTTIIAGLVAYILVGALYLLSRGVAALLLALGGGS
jgi:hypothetical protein